MQLKQGICAVGLMAMTMALGTPAGEAESTGTGDAGTQVRLQFVSAAVQSEAQAPPELVNWLAGCRQPDEPCTLKELAKDQQAYNELRLWCSKNNYIPILWNPGVFTVCDTLTEYHRKDVEALKEAHASAKKDKAAAKEALEKAEKRVQDLEDAQKTRPAVGKGGGDTIPASGTTGTAPPAVSPELDTARKDLANARTKLADAQTRLDEAKKKLTDPEKRFENIDDLELMKLGDTLSRPIRRCGGFGLLMPLVSARRGAERTYHVSGPVEAGIGGGYYWDIVCDNNWSLGPDLFGFSEGLNPAQKFHIAVGAGLSLSAFKYFHFGFGLGYDLFRYRADVKVADGLFANPNKTNFTLLFSFNVMGAESNNQSSTTTPAPPVKEAAKPK